MKRRADTSWRRPFEVTAQKGTIIVALVTPKFITVHYKPVSQSHLILRERTKTDDHALLAKACKAANAFDLTAAGDYALLDLYPHARTSSVTTVCIGTSRGYGGFLQSRVRLAPGAMRGRCADRSSPRQDTDLTGIS